ncbi:MAG: N-acyl-D-amino-acid deacylase [Oceanicoccus sp.]|jgi:N-acyl-D-amino-acid deacylase
MLDLLVKNGRVVDGSGLPAYNSDIGIKDGRILRIGKISEDAKQVIDAEGKIVAPGFIDPHTHFDAQLLWDGYAKPSIAHGITTIVPGNCSLSLAPLKAEHRKKLVGMFNQIEEMPIAAFEQGVEWNWETFDEFVKRIESELSINVAPLVGHSALRLWVMGDAANQRIATQAEVEAMQELLRECLRAGAVGMSTSFVDFDEKMQPVPCRYSDTRELNALSAVLGEFGRILQIVNEFFDADLTVARIDQLADISLAYNITTTFSPLFVNNDSFDAVDKIISRVEEQFARGARVWPQVQTRPIDISFCFESPSLLFIRLPSWYSIIRFGSHEDIIGAFSNSEMRAKLTAEAAGMTSVWEQLILRQVKHEKNEALVGKTLLEIAQQRNSTAIDVMIDISLEEDLQAHFLSANMGHNDVQKVGELLAHPNVLVGASDGGAHILSFATFGDTGHLISQFVRKAGLLSLEQAIKKITLDTATIWGIPDRGLLKPNYVADITIFDEATIDRGPEYFVQDVPGDGHRYVRDAIGIDTVIIGGAISYQHHSGYTESHRGVVLPAAQAQ